MGPVVGRAKEPRALIAASAAKLTKAESALLQIVLTPRLALSPPAEEAFDAGGGWPLVSDLDPAARSAAEALLDAGWLEVRHDGGLLAACAMEPHATLRPGWRAELVILGAPARALAGLSVLPSFEPASADASSLVWSSDASRIA